MASPSVGPQPNLPRRRKLRAKERYQLQEQIGAGGMGTVYRALDAELNRTVAVKVLRPELVPNLQNLLRLKRELVLASRVNDEHVVRVHDIGEIDGQALITMDWVDGENLAQLLKRVHRLPPSQVRNFALQICQALRAIHAANVVHHDLKPGNLIIRWDGTILVSDFGLARSTSLQDSHGSAPEDAAGTRAYMAPEQLAGLPADARSDLYALGLVLLEMLTDSLALETLAPLRLELLNTCRDKYRRSVELRCLGLLDPVIRRCLNPDRTERYQSADAVLEDLKLSEPESSEQHSERWKARIIRSRGWRVALPAGLAVLLLSGYGVLRHRAAHNAVLAGQLYARAMTLLNDQSSEIELRGALGMLNQLVELAPNHAASFPVRVNTLIRLYETSHDPRWLAEARNTLESRAAAHLDGRQRTLFSARINIDAGLFSDAIRALQGNSELLESSEEANRLLGRAFIATQQIEPGVASYRAAIHLEPDSWRAHNDLGAALLNLGKVDSAAKEFVRVTQLRPDSPVGYENLGSAFLAGGDFQKARKTFEIALERAPSGPAYYNLGVAAYYSREYAASIPFFEAAIRARPTSDVYAGGLADSLRRLRRMERSREQYVTALSLLDKLAQTRPLGIIEQCRRAMYLARFGDAAAAETVLDRMPADQKDSSKEISYASAVVAVAEGRPRAAQRHLRNAVLRGYPPALIEMNPDFDDVPP